MVIIESTPSIKLQCGCFFSSFYVPLFPKLTWILASLGWETKQIHGDCQMKGFLPFMFFESTTISLYSRPDGRVHFGFPCCRVNIAFICRPDSKSERIEKSHRYLFMGCSLRKCQITNDKTHKKAAGLAAQWMFLLKLSSRELGSLRPCCTMRLIGSISTSCQSKQPCR